MDSIYSLLIIKNWNWAIISNNLFLNKFKKDNWLNYNWFPLFLFILVWVLDLLCYVSISMRNFIRSIGKYWTNISYQTKCRKIAFWGNKGIAWNALFDDMNVEYKVELVMFLLIRMDDLRLMNVSMCNYQFHYNIILII